MIVLFFGPPASGKGTQAELLSKRLSVPTISVGELLRNVPISSPYYSRVNEQLENGVLVDFDIVVGILKDRIEMLDCARGYILDGWGRRMSDIKGFNPQPDLVIHVVIPKEESIKRITGRRICEADGKTYNIYTLPKEELEKCNGNLIQRDDDTLESVTTRLVIYEHETLPVVNFFKERGTLVEVDGMGAPKDVFNTIITELQKRGIGI